MKIILEMSGSIQRIEVKDDGTSAFIFSKNEEYTRDLEIVRKLTGTLIKTKEEINKILKEEE